MGKVKMHYMNMVNQFNETLNDEPVIICGISFNKSDILEEMDPIGYDEQLTAYLDYYESME
jgi:hypothetical protein